MKKFIVSIIMVCLLAITFTSCKQAESSKNGNEVLPGQVVTIK